MNLLRHRLIRWPVVLIGCVAWFAIANHCALGALQVSADAPMPSCHESPESKAPAKHDEQENVECCKILRATLLTFAKPVGSLDLAGFVPFLLLATEIPVRLQLPARSPLELDTGPPCASTFAEIVLQRSILAHAPPFAS
jgi:hypothetical protein